ncbi:hypothetical protein LJC60_02570 [Ruminococcaceae bacterium OttesenSCG-928-D13]|nr:hypothetical protein [Ruminococcaceae bacterium OttesenSCG-928-D13]
MQLEHKKDLAISLLVSVVDRDSAERVTQILEGKRSYFNLVSLGYGTANSRTLSYLGLGETEKAVFFCIMPDAIARAVMGALDERLELSKPGRGIAFSMNVLEGCYHLPVQLTGKPESGGTDMECQSNHDLIIVILNRGYTEEVMDEARAAGAAGGTVLHARGCGLAGAEKFFGVTIQPEKEMMMIVAGNDVSCNIMGAIAEKVGPGTEAGAISFSMPVNGVRGLGNSAPN